MVEGMGRGNSVCRICGVIVKEATLSFIFLFPVLCYEDRIDNDVYRHIYPLFCVWVTQHHISAKDFRHIVHQIGQLSNSWVLLPRWCHNRPLSRPFNFILSSEIFLSDRGHCKISTFCEDELTPSLPFLWRKYHILYHIRYSLKVVYSMWCYSDELGFLKVHEWLCGQKY